MRHPLLLHSVSYAGLWGQSFLPVDAFLAKFPGEPFALRLGAQSLVELGQYAKGREDRKSVV